jgi:hypothetical protein
VVSGIDCRHWRIVFGGEPTDVRGVFDAAVDGETGSSIEFVVQQLISVRDPSARVMQQGHEKEIKENM